MERNDEQLIREKILGLERRTTESTSGLWDSVVLQQGQPKTRHTVIYLAAASVVLAGALVMYSVQRSYQASLALKIAEIELLLNNPSIAQLPENVVATTSECPEPQPMERIEKRKRQTPIAQTQRKAPSLVTDQEATVASPVNDKESTTQPAEVTMTPDVQLISSTEPVIALKTPAKIVLGTPLEQPSTAGQKHLKFRLISQERVEEPSGNRTPPVSLFNINN